MDLIDNAYFIKELAETNASSCTCSRLPPAAWLDGRTFPFPPDDRMGARVGIRLNSAEPGIIGSLPPFHPGPFCTRNGRSRTSSSTWATAAYEVIWSGGLSAVSAPANIRLEGKTMEEACERTNDARAIAWRAQICPCALEISGNALRRDMRKVVALKMVPTSHGGSTLVVGRQAARGSCPFRWEPFREGY
jgi:hypothetical protein